MIHSQSNSPMANILVVDDTPANLQLLIHLLRENGYKASGAVNGPLALSVAVKHPPDLIFLDVKMPGMDDFEVCAELKRQTETRNIPIIFISALDNPDDKVRAFEEGGVDYITKPFEPAEVLARIRTQLFVAQTTQDLEQQVSERTAKLIASEERLRQNLLQTIQAIASTIEKRDPYTAGHQQRVANLAVAIAQEMGFDEHQIMGIRMGGMIHDIGKIYIPAEILSRPGCLTSDEFEIIKSHPDVGYDIIKNVDFPWPVVEMVHQHHERLNGSGYPLGLNGDEIILEARVLAVADVVEAINSHRPYRPGLGIDAALEEIEKHRGTLYDATVVESCIQLFREKQFIFD
ncbi:MAG: HD domain-containing phosphohydrolase [Candidatus Thiodiazotropha sp.]